MRRAAAAELFFFVGLALFFPPTNLNFLSRCLSLLHSTDDAFRSRFLWARKPMLAAAAARLSCGGSLPPPRSLVW